MVAGTAGAASVLRAVQQRMLAEHPHLLGPAAQAPGRRQQVERAVRRILAEEGVAFHAPHAEALAAAVVSELIGCGPLDGLLADASVTEIMVNGPAQVFVERDGRIEPAPSVRFRDAAHLLHVIARIVAPLGRRVDQSQPYVDARLPDGSRVHAILDPIAVGGPVLTIRKFNRAVLSLEQLVAAGACGPATAALLRGAVLARLNLVVSGGTGSGKTTLLNALLGEVPAGERLITIEEALELRPAHPHRVALEARPPGPEGGGAVTVRDLVRNALRMRPDRLVVGEVRGKEAFDLLNALNTGHDGALSTLHANGALDALHRLENMVLMAGEGLPHAVVRDQVRAAVDLVVHLERTPAGTRRIQRVVAADKRRAAALRVVELHPERADSRRAWPEWLRRRLGSHLPIPIPIGETTG